MVAVSCCIFAADKADSGNKDGKEAQAFRCKNKKL